MRRFVYTKILDINSIKDILVKSGYTVRTARMILKDLGYSMKDLKEKYYLNKDTLNFSFAFNDTKTRNYIYNRVEEVVLDRAREDNSRYSGVLAWTAHTYGLFGYRAESVARMIRENQINKLIEYGEDSINNLP